MSPDEFVEEFETRRRDHALLEPGLTIELSPLGREAVSFDCIEVPPMARGNKTARRALHLLLALADEHAMALRVIPHALSDGGLTSEELARWYLRHGFSPAAKSAIGGELWRTPTSKARSGDSHASSCNPPAGHSKNRA